MHRLRLPHVLLAILLALIAPLEQGRCLCGTLLPHTMRAPVAMAMASPHCASACCQARAAARGAQHGQPGKASSQACACSSFSSGVLPAVPTLSAGESSVAAFVLLPSIASVEPVLESREYPPALDVGSPPLPATRGAHGLRAPPALA